jgi:nucleoside-diphosphate kinase
MPAALGPGADKESIVSQRTFSIIKPDAVKAGNAGAILSRLEKAGFRIVALRMRSLKRAEAEGFYHVHEGKPFFASLCAFMSSGPCITMVLEGDDAIARLREIMGATNPASAAPGTIRRDFAASIETNAIHGSDAPETAAFEIGYFFPGLELV